MIIPKGKFVSLKLILLKAVKGWVISSLLLNYTSEGLKFKTPAANLTDQIDI
jgi:hypothetical protein